MKGSEKQIKWAENIKAQAGLDQLLGQFNEIADKAIGYINSIDSAKFWIDYRTSDARRLMEDLATVGLQIDGLNHSTRATMSPDGEITVTWTEIVQDGKGGSKVTRSKTL